MKSTDEGKIRKAEQPISPGKSRGRKAVASPRPTAGNAAAPLRANEALSPYKTGVWQQLTPRERLRRSWEMVSRLPDPRAVHDSKLFPKP